jgi:TPR repeat protein
MAVTASNHGAQRAIIEPPRRPPWLVAFDLYRAGGSFRGFLEFALTGAIVLAFLPGGGMASFATSWMGGRTAPAATAPAPVPPGSPGAGIAKPHIPLAPRIGDLKIDPSYFDHVEEPLRSQLRTALAAYYARNARAASNAIESAHAQDRHALLVRGLNLLSMSGAPNVRGGLSLLQEAADKGEPRAMAVLGVLKVSGLPGVMGRDTDAGRDLLARASAAGDAAAARVMGEGFVTGWMGAVDPGRAEQYLRLASDRGELRGTLQLGEMLMTGHGVPKDEREGERLIHKAAIGGYPEAQAMYGVMRFLPYAGGLTDDPNEALEWLERAAAQSEPHAMYYLGMFYVEYGKRIGRLDPARGVDLFRRCTEKTMDRECIFAYATALDLGIGTPRDAVKAYAVYSIAAANENAGKARTRRDEVAKSLSQQQIVQAHQITNELVGRLARASEPPPPRLTETFADRIKDLR